MTRLSIAFGLLLASNLAWAEDFDGSRALICVTTDTFSCVPGLSCVEASAEELNMPESFQIDFAERYVFVDGRDGKKNAAGIRTLEVSEGELVLQGMQRGRSWSAAITQESGDMALSAVGDRVAFVVFASCAPLEES